MNEKIFDDYERKPLVLDYDVEEVAARYRRLYTALVYDTMETMGLSGRSMKPGIGPLDHDINSNAHKVAGPAFTIRRKTMPDMDTHTHNIRLGLVMSMTQGCVLVSDVQGNDNCGQFGEITATTMRAHGCVGAVIDGSTRDSDYLVAMGFPTFVRWCSPVEGLSRSMITEYQVSVFIHGVDGLLRVNPGDYIFGDGDGIVVVPQEKTLEVVELAEKAFDAEKCSRQAMREGENPFEVYNKYGRF